MLECSFGLGAFILNLSAERLRGQCGRLFQITRPGRGGEEVGDTAFLESERECAQSLLHLPVLVVLVSTFASVHWRSVQVVERNRICTFGPTSQRSQVQCGHLGHFLFLWCQRVFLEVVKVAQISCAQCSLLLGWVSIHLSLRAEQTWNMRVASKLCFRLLLLDTDASLHEVCVVAILSFSGEL